MNKKRFNVGQRVSVTHFKTPIHSNVHTYAGKRTRIGTILKLQRTRCVVAIDEELEPVSVPKYMLMGDPYE